MLFVFYAYRSLLARARANVFTLLTVALFVAGSTLGLTFYLGLKQRTVNAAPAENIAVIAKGASSEIDSLFDADTVHRLSVRDGARPDSVVREMVTEIHVDTVAYGVYKRPIRLRGIDETSLRVHRATIVEGVAPAPNSLELLVGTTAAARYPRLKVGSTVHLPSGDCKVVGIFKANGGPFEAEIWTPRSAVEMHAKDNRINIVTLVAESASRAPQLVEQINGSKDLQAQAKTYEDWWEERARLRTITWVVLLLLIMLSIVAAVAIAATMNAAVAARIPELAALAAIGVRKKVLAKIVLLESAFLGVFGGAVGVLVGIAIGSRMHEVSLSDNPIAVTPSLAIGLLGAGLGIGVALLGGLVPSLHVRRLDVLRAMR